MDGVDAFFYGWFIIGIFDRHILNLLYYKDIPLPWM